MVVVVKVVIKCAIFVVGFGVVKYFYVRKYVIFVVIFVVRKFFVISKLY